MIIFLYFMLGVFGQKGSKLLNHVVYLHQSTTASHLARILGRFEMMLQKLQTHF